MNLFLTPEKAIKLLESNNSRIYKETIIATQIAEKNVDLFEGFRLALDPMITFGVKKVPMFNGAKQGKGLTWADFKLLSKKLAQREITGNDARDAIETAMKIATKDQWDHWYRRILIKDLRCGVTEKTVNNVVKRHGAAQYKIPVFACQLAHDSAKYEGELTGRKMLEVKLDGVRVITIAHPNGNVVQYSRNGKELLNFGHIKEQIARTVYKFSEPMVLDGEVMSASFQDLMTQVNRKSNVNAKDAVLHLFDIVTLKDFQKGKCNIRQEDRTKALKTWYLDDMNPMILANVQILAHEIVDLDTDEGDEKFSEINARALDGGYEGIMVKDLDAPYLCKRSRAWLKLKPFIEISLTAKEVEEGTGKNKGRMGAVLFEGVDDGVEISVSVGGGYSDKQRDDFWKNRKKVPGMIGEIRADAVTKNKNGTFSLRFPRFLRFRGFKKGEKL